MEPGRGHNQNYSTWVLQLGPVLKVPTTSRNTTSWETMSACKAFQGHSTFKLDKRM